MTDQASNPSDERLTADAPKQAVAALEFVSVVVLPAVTMLMDPNEVFRNHSWLQVCGNFRNRVLPVLRPISSAPEASFVVSRLTKSVCDSVIRKELPKQHLIEWYRIISFIGKQPNGEDGMLLTTNDSGNIFYMRGIDGEIFNVRVKWNPHSKYWFVFGWELEERGYWHANDHVFYPDNTTC